MTPISGPVRVLARNMGPLARARRIPSGLHTRSTPRRRLGCHPQPQRRHSHIRSNHDGSTHRGGNHVCTAFGNTNARCGRCNRRQHRERLWSASGSAISDCARRLHRISRRGRSLGIQTRSVGIGNRHRHKFMKRAPKTSYVRGGGIGT